MATRRRLFALVIAAAGLILGLLVTAFRFRAEDVAKDPPNYTAIEENLYMGGYVPEPPESTRAVLNLCESEDPFRCEVESWQPVPDADPAPSIEWLTKQVAFIEAQRREGRQTYVHCRAGVSRAGMVTAAYLMFEHGWTRDEALAFIRTKRPQVNPNPAFMERLREWEKLVVKTKGMS